MKMRVINKNSRNIGAVMLSNLLDELGYDSIKDFQDKHKIIVDGLFGNQSWGMLYHVLVNPISVEFNNHYYSAKYEKKQIIWHHSAGWDNARGMFNWWKIDGRNHVATAIGIVDSGRIYRGFHEDYWAHHIGAKTEDFQKLGIGLNYKKSKKYGWYVSNNEVLNQHSIAVEVCNWGHVKELPNGNFSTYTGHELPKEKVIAVDYKGFTHFEDYTEQEISTLRYWTLLCAIRWDIPLNYSEKDMWSLSKKAMSGDEGLYTHNSFRTDKNDVYPNPKLVQMAQSLEKMMV